MAYGERARDLRRCQALTRGGQPRRQYAVWTDAQGRCATHGGRVEGAHQHEKTAYIPCRCMAYVWPHRPGSGLCNTVSHGTVVSLSLRHAASPPRERSAILQLCDATGYKWPDAPEYGLMMRPGTH